MPLGLNDDDDRRAYIRDHIWKIWGRGLASGQELEDLLHLLKTAGSDALLGHLYDDPQARPRFP